MTLETGRGAFPARRFALGLRVNFRSARPKLPQAPPPALPMAVKCLLGILVRHVRESGRLLVRMPRIGRCWAQADVRPMIWPVIFYHHKFGPHTSGTARLTEVENASASSLRDLYLLILATTTLHVGN